MTQQDARAALADYICEEIGTENWPQLTKENWSVVVDALRQPAAPGGEDWKDDPSSDERWNAGLDFGMQQFCKALDIDPAKVTWDAATETVDGDVQAVIWNILRARFGDDWNPDAAPSDERAKVVEGAPIPSHEDQS